MARTAQLTDAEVDALLDMPCWCGRQPCHRRSHWYAQSTLLAQRAATMRTEEAAEKARLSRACDRGLWGAFKAWVRG